MLPFGLEHPNAPGDRFLALELVRQHAERPGLIRQGVADDVAFEEQLAGLLGLRPVGEAEEPRDNTMAEIAMVFMTAPFPPGDASACLIAADYTRLQNRR